MPRGRSRRAGSELFPQAAKPWRAESRSRHVRVLEISVINGDLLFVPQPLMLGHYTSLRLTGTERVVDTLLGGAMSASLGAGVYPNAPGEHQMFINTGVNRDNPLQLPRPEAAIVVGLGEEGKLRPAELALAVCRAVIGWSQRLTEKSAARRGRSKSRPRSSAAAAWTSLRRAGGIAHRAGVRDANKRLAETRWPIVGHLHFVELYLDRAVRCLAHPAGAGGRLARGASSSPTPCGPGRGAAALARLGLSRRRLRLPVRR